MNSCAQPFSITVSSVQLLAYWKLEEGTGVYPKVDATGNGHDLSQVNTATVQVAGIIGFAQQFTLPGVAPALENTVGSTLLAFDKTRGFTLCAWAYFTGSQFAMNFVFPFIAVNDSPTNRFEMQLTSTGSTGIQVNLSLSVTQKLGANPTTSQSATVALPSLNAWHFVRGWWDPTDGFVRVCVDEGPVSVSALSIGLNWPGDSNAMNVILLKSNTAPTTRLDEVGYWKGVFSASEAAYIYNAGAGRTYPDVPGA